MKKISFAKNWKCYVTGDRDKVWNVEIPHDAMQLDPKAENSPSGVNLGWYAARDYTYEKEFFAPEEWQEQRVLLEFEGVYRKAAVYLNNQKIGYQEYGYSGFSVDLTEQLIFGRSNIIRVEVINHDQPNSRWYSGTGIYRPVWLNLIPADHIVPEKTRITTVEVLR
ncbi:MAG: hypothetical protein Q4B26_13030 [Eubacteriales bacterium]|nr:hypothetical protein [Eubacteriales bacterium]